MKYYKIKNQKPQLLRGYQSVPVPVKNLERVRHVLFHVVALLHHHLNELVEVDGAVGVGVHVPDHVFQVILARVEPMSPHHLAHNNILASGETGKLYESDGLGEFCESGES